MTRLIRKLSTMTNTLLFRFTAWYILSFLVVIIIMGTIIIGTISYFMLDNSIKEMDSVQHNLLIASKEKTVDWQEALDTLLYPNHANYSVEILNNHNQTIATSRGWGKHPFVFTNKQKDIYHHLLFWNQSKGFFLSKSFHWDNLNGYKGTIHLFVQLVPIEHLLSLLIRILEVTTIIGVIIGSLFIYWLTKRNVKPLIAITSAVYKMKESHSLDQRVPVPRGPVELRELATVFNNVLNELEKKLDKEKSFIANASHELRTPITALRGHLNLIKRWGKKDPVVLDQSIDAIYEEGLRMQRLISQLLTLARTADNHEIKMKSVKLSQIIQESLTQLHHVLRVKKIQLDIDDNISVNGNPDLLIQLVIILLENAAKFTDDKGIIKLKLFKDTERVHLIISDNGIGIPSEEMNHIFERFYRVDKHRSRNTGGTGLGLSIAKEIVILHQGSISVTSSSGQGSQFDIDLPRIQH